jgi:hypothetical protein
MPPPAPPPPQLAQLAQLAPAANALAQNKIPNNTGGKYNTKARTLFTSIKNVVQSLRSSPNQQTITNARNQMREINGQINQIQVEYSTDINNLYLGANKRLNKTNINLKFNPYKSCVNQRNCPRIRDMDNVLSTLRKYLTNQVAMLTKVAQSNATKKRNNMTVIANQQTASRRVNLNRNVQALLREMRNIQQKI